jgi:hypothetical protein
LYSRLSFVIQAVAILESVKKTNRAFSLDSVLIVSASLDVKVALCSSKRGIDNSRSGATRDCAITNYSW